MRDGPEFEAGSVDAYELCTEAGVDISTELTKFVMHDYASVIVSSAVDCTREEAIELLKMAIPHKLADRIVEASHYTEVFEDLADWDLMELRKRRGEHHDNDRGTEADHSEFHGAPDSATHAVGGASQGDGELG